MDSVNNTSPETQPVVAGAHLDAAPNLGIVAANIAPSNQNVAPTMPEVGLFGGQEVLSNPETQTGPVISSQQPLQQSQQVQAQPQTVLPATPVAPATSIVSSAPAVAADEDLIEKEWVEKAKKVVSSTRDNPHEQARLVAELMRDYVRKRYAKEVGKAPDGI